MNAIFNKKLYWEGIKKTKVVGIVFAAVTAVLSALIPLVSMIDWFMTDPQNRSTYAVTASTFCVPALLLTIPASLAIVSSMFSYLNKRSESDFYHSIPYKRSCVYISFMASCMSWLVFTALISIGASAFLYWIHPGTTCAISIPFANLGICILLAATLAATAAVAMTITGTALTNVLIMLLMIFFVPIIGSLYTVALDMVVPILYIPLTPARFIQPSFSLPLAVFNALTSYNEAALFNNAPMIIYTVIVTLVLFVIGCLLYMKRPSEMASKSAPNKLLQHVYRCAITLPLALLATIMLYVQEYDGIIFFFILAVLSLLVYFIYELITTKRFRNLLKAMPALGVLVGCCLVFAGAVEVAKATTLAYTPDVDDIVSIGKLDYVEPLGMGYYDPNSYEDIKTGEIEIDSDEAAEIVANALANSIDYVKDDSFYNYYPSIDEEEYTYRMVKITDRSGKVCGRYLRLPISADKKLDELFLASEDYADALISMPTEREVQSVYTYGYMFWLNSADEQKLWDSFVDEYNTLSREEKLEYKALTVNNHGYITYDYSGGEVIYQDGVEIEIEATTDVPGIEPDKVLTTFDVTGTVGTQTFNSCYDLHQDFFPKTCALYAELANSIESTEEMEYGMYYGYHTVSTYGIDAMRDCIPLMEKAEPGFFSCNIGYNYLDAQKSGKTAETVEIMTFILDHSVGGDEVAVYLSLNIYVEGECDCYALVGLTAEDFETLNQMYAAYWDFEQG